MYRVIDKNGNTVALCSRKEDAAAWLNSHKEQFKIKRLTSNK